MHHRLYYCLLVYFPTHLAWHSWYRLSTVQHTRRTSSRGRCRTARAHRGTDDSWDHVRKWQHPPQRASLNRGELSTADCSSFQLQNKKEKALGLSTCVQLDDGYVVPKYPA